LSDVTGGAHIYEQGYRGYDGPRLGVAASIRSLAVHSIRRGLGLRRTFWSKLLPIATVVIAYVPAAVFVGIAAIIPDELTDEVDAIPDYAGYFSNITAAIILFVAIVGPEVLCSDRKNGMLGMYLASPLTRETYLLAKVLAVLPVLLLVTFGPQLLLLVGRTLVDAGPETIGDFAILLVRTIVAGFVVASVYTAVSLAAASLTDRRAVASAGVILTLLISGTVTTALVEDADFDRALYLLNLSFLPLELVHRVYGESGAEQGLATGSLVGAACAWVFASAAVVLWRYQKLTVSR
jgi:ABC-2 type transport system permease protein